LLQGWEDNKGHPTFSLAEKLAAVLHVPFGYLFLSAPPENEIPIPDLRTVGLDRPPRMSVDFLDILRGCLLRQQWYSQYLKDGGYAKLDFPGSTTIEEGFQATANAISAALGIHDGLREESDTWEEFRNKLAAAAEHIGVLVMQSGVGANTHRPLDVSEFRGFAALDAYAPLVFINGKDAATARIFTLVHELAHIWIGTSGISNPEPKTKASEQPNAVERFCNKVAAEVLVPRLGIIKRWIVGGSLFENIHRIAKYYRVSRYVAVRQAHEQNLISRNTYIAYLDDNPSLWMPSDSDSSGGNFYPTFYNRNSRRVIRGVIKALGENKVTYREASTLFGVRVGTLKTLAERLGE
jgi:Zn-dependent peptidase ImmA (M78 family)